MSAIKQELMQAAEIKPKDGETEDAFLARLVTRIGSEIDTEQWDKLSAAAQDWNNLGSDAIDAQKPFPPFPDAEVAPSSSRRRGAAATPPAAPAPAPFVPKVGAAVTITTKRGKVETGVIVELTADEVIINANGEDGAKEDDKEFALANVTIEPVGVQAASTAASPAAPEPKEPKTAEVGDTVEAVTARDKILVGNILVIDGDDLVLVDASGAEHELLKSKLKSIVVKVKNAKSGMTSAPAAPAAPESTGRRGRSAAASPPAADTKPEEGKRTRSSNAGAAQTLGGRIRELICDNPAVTAEQVQATLTKENYQFAETSVRMIHKDTTVIIGMLRERGLLK